MSEGVTLSLAAFIGLMSLLLLFAGVIITGMRMYASVAQDMAALKTKVEALDRIHNGHEQHDDHRRR